MSDSKDKSREVRIGLVLYGGVSLAIYIHGVTQEFFWAMRGRGIYKLLKALTDSDIVVDVVSGTSAGGINGLLLSYALCNERDFSRCANLWRESGDIRALLRNPADMKSHASLLDSEGYYQPRLEEAIATMPPISSADDDPSSLQELDLFVTGTNVAGNLFHTFDDAGHPITVKDHRNLFVLKHRKGRKEQLCADAKNKDVLVRALAKLSRITSCFPAAFAPVGVSTEPDADPADQLLAYWGKIDKSTYFLDGGVLDNKPFTSTVRSIFYRMADRPVERKLFYVEPDPEHFREGKIEQPQIIGAVRQATSIPGYESIADDLKLLAERNGRISRQNRMQASLQDHPDSPSPELTAFAERMNQRASGKDVTSPPDSEACGYAHSRLVSLSEKAVRLILQSGERDRALEPAQRTIATAMFRQYDAWPGSGEDTLYLFDSHFRLRRLFHLLYLPDLTMGGAAATLDTRRGTEGWIRTANQVIGRQIKLVEIIQNAMERLLENAPFPWKTLSSENTGQIWQDVSAALLHLLNQNDPAGAILPDAYLYAWQMGAPDSWLEQKMLSDINERLITRADFIIDAIRRGRQLPAQSGFIGLQDLAEQTERRMLSWLSGQADAAVDLIREYENFLLIDASMYPLQVCSEVEEKDIIETIQISPEPSVAFSNKPLTDKVSGDVLGHFGGFLKRSWRSNDILWGRLDGLCQIVLALFTRERIAAVTAIPEKRDALRDRLLDGDLRPQLLFPNAGAATHERLSRWFERLCAESDERLAALEPAEFERLRELLIEAAQLEVLHTDLPAVVGDAVQEQMRWNKYRIGNTSQAPNINAYDAETGCFYRTGATQQDGLVAAIASEELALQAINRLSAANAGQTASRPMDTPLGRFFSGPAYRVGKESLWSGKDIPYAVLLDIAASLLLVLYICLPASFGDGAERIRRNRVYRVGKALLWGLRAFAEYNLRSHGCPRAIFYGANLIALLALAVGVIWWSSLIHPHPGWSLGALLVFILIPLGFFVVEVGWFVRRGMR